MLFKTLAAVLLDGGIVLASLGQVFAYTQDEMLNEHISYQVRQEKVDTRIDDMIELARSKVGVAEYVWGATGQNNTYDCSGFTLRMFESIGINLPRCAWQQSEVGQTVSIDEIRKGDILFFHTTDSRQVPYGITYVAIATSVSTMVHAKSSRAGIVEQPISDYKDKIVTVKRVIDND